MEVAAASNPMPAPSNPSQSNPSVSSVRLLHKNRLQEYAQRSAIPLPIYHTFNEGSPHAPRFRSTVIIDGATYTSSHTFQHRKAAEQDVAKFALDNISRKIKDEGCPLIAEDTVFCKSILNEFAVKMNVEMPKYNTTQSEGLLPVFVSSLSFDGTSYTGGAGKNKKEAEQMAARTAIQSILGNSGSGTTLSQIIKSKIKLYHAIHKVSEFTFPHDMNTTMGGRNLFNMPQIAYSEPMSSGLISLAPVSNPSVSEFKKPKEEMFNEIAPGSTDGAHFNQTMPLVSPSDSSLVAQVTSPPAQIPTSSTLTGVPPPSQTEVSQVKTADQLVAPAPTVSFVGQDNVNAGARKRSWWKNKKKNEAKRQRTDANADAE
ncbi:uncharacterized protein LOC143884375 [Tasmannia lanceolata]|uniref:uncharacterized protein LOC143884375 n=1 Tax=Tasmannia lanceolata TaxID=3420 RepID=UPI004062BC7A